MPPTVKLKSSLTSKLKGKAKRLGIIFRKIVKSSFVTLKLDKLSFVFLLKIDCKNSKVILSLAVSIVGKLLKNLLTKVKGLSSQRL